MSQTVVSGLQLEIWAVVDDPVVLTAAPDGSLYVGRDFSGSGGGPDDPVPIHHISATGQVSEFGPGIDDPDVVLFDATGLAAPLPGSILVAGRDQGSVPFQGGVSAVAPDGSATTIIGPTTDLDNPAGLALDSAGRLLVSSYSVQIVYAYVGTTGTPLINSPTNPIEIAEDPSTGELLVSGADGLIRRYTASGTLLDGAFGFGRALAYGPGNATFGNDLYTVRNDSGELQRIDPTGTVTVLGSGFQLVWGLTFGADGALYVGEFGKDRVLRISPDCMPLANEAADLVLASEDGGASLHFSWNDAIGATDHVVLEDPSPNGWFRTETGVAASGLVGLTVPMPPGDVFFLVAGRDGCGQGPR